MVAGSPRTKEYFLHKWSYEQIKERIESIQDIKLKALFCCLYGGMCRISELTGNKTKLKQGLRKQDIEEGDRETKEGKKHIIYLTLWNEKQSKEQAIKVVVINATREPWLTKPILAWKEQCLTETLFPHSRIWAFNKVKQYFGFHPHYFRKARTTHFLTGQVTGRPETVEGVRKQGGWTSAKTMMQSYSDYSTQDQEEFV